MFYLKFFILFILYFLPIMIAGYRDHDRSISILLLNIALGWTGVGWILALVWSLSSLKNRPRSQ
ncbi:MAG: superinfection immunity protein [Alphaproteobacteria bacterium]|nr:superinfection immunity protein [Alphaproteobacteria bacterium]